MKILIVNTYDIQGGAARAAYRLHRSLIDNGIDSHMLVVKKESDDFTVIPFTPNNGITKKFLRRFQDKFMNPLKKYPNGSKTFFSPAYLGFSNMVETINQVNPDIVHLHWICDEMIKVEDIVSIKAPIAWSLHDMWVFTGGCHYDEECKGYKKECGNCKVLGSDKENDLSKQIFYRKQKAYELKKDMTIIGLSRWLCDASKSSSLLKDKKHVNLPNPIDTNVFKPFDKDKARELWSLPKDKKLVLFGAIGATSDPRKGFKELRKAFSQMDKNDEMELVVFGGSKPEKASNFGFGVHYLGHFYDDMSLVTLYNAVDVMVVPSLQENLSNAIMESLACETPVVGFDIGGNSDMIEHKKTGYLAKPFDTGDLKNGIEWVLNLDENQYAKICKNARKKVLKEFDSNVVAQKYIELYREVLNG